MEVQRIDLRVPRPERQEAARRTAKIIHAFNQEEPYTDRYFSLMQELFSNRMGDGAYISSPFYCNLAENIHIGTNVVIMPYFRCMSAGNVFIEDNARIAMNVSVITNNHDPYERDILTVQDVRIGKNAWVGAGSTILPGVTIGENAIIGAASVVTKDIPDNAVAVGSPAKVIKMLDPEKFHNE